MIESWCRHCKAERPHASLGYKPRASEVCLTGFGRPGDCAGPASAVTLERFPAGLNRWGFQRR